MQRVSSIRDLSALLKLPELERVFVTQDNYEQVAAFFAGTDVQVIIE